MPRIEISSQWRIERSEKLFFTSWRIDMERYLLGLYEKSMPNTLSLGDKLTTAAEAGYDYMELSIDESDEKQKRLDWGADEIRTLHADMEKAGIPIGSICLSGHRKFPLGHPSTEIQEQSLDIMDRAIGLASKLGIRVIQIAGYDVYYLPSSDETVENFGRNLARSVEMAAKAGVILAFETMETPFMDTTEKAMHWVREIDSPYLQIYPDTGNVVNAVNQYGSTLSADFPHGKGTSGCGPP